jgi:predicted aminopeptidase
VLSTTLREDSVDLANTVVHELTHNGFYAPGQAVFNESFASFVGAHGSERFFRARGDTASARRAARALGRRPAARRLLAGARDLDRLGVRRARRSRVGRQRRARGGARRRVRACAAPARRLGGAASVGARCCARGPWAARVQLDNAALLARRTYARDLPLFDAVLSRERGELRRAVSRIVALARSRPADPYGAVRDWVAAAKRGRPALTGRAPGQRARIGRALATARRPAASSPTHAELVHFRGRRRYRHVRTGEGPYVGKTASRAPVSAPPFDRACGL